MDGHLYRGCLGRDACPVDRCWNGRRLRPCSGSIRADAFDQPLQVLRYTASDCANCLHAIDLTVDGAMRTPAGRRVDRWTICQLGLWAGPATLYNLLNHRAPVKRLGHCSSFADTPRDAMRPELVKQRLDDKIRARADRARLREQRKPPKRAPPKG